ncbi:MAG: hypothetical protein ONB46_06450 [candidate division KSB1 bacterium]|nr:hypothetical protein [candidate division KSB1 bacterium]MDZ7365344.1 hypothetical protein [candidate division KSB1 bacterium]MDZ7407447.1 hypothetical protein [candidate division KSB1 bacterium]
MSARIEKYLASGLSQKAFCAQENLAFSTFQCWLRKNHAHRRHTVAPSARGNSFIPLYVRQTPLAPPPLSCVIEFPNGVNIRLSAQVNLQLLSHHEASGAKNFLH